MFELIIFTMMTPHVEPRWQNLGPFHETVCIEKKLEFEELFADAKVEGFAFSFECEPVEEEEDD